MKFLTDGNSLLCLHQGEKLRIEPWGRDSLRVRATMLPAFSDRDWALTEAVKKGEAPITVEEVDHWVGDGSIDKREQATIVNGRIKAVVNHAGVISFYRDDGRDIRGGFTAACPRLPRTGLARAPHIMWERWEKRRCTGRF